MNRVLGTDGHGDDVAMRMMDRVGGADLSGVDHLLDQFMVACELEQRITAAKIGPAIPTPQAHRMLTTYQHTGEGRAD